MGAATSPGASLLPWKEGSCSKEASIHQDPSRPSGRYGVFSVLEMLVLILQTVPQISCSETHTESGTAAGEGQIDEIAVTCAHACGPPAAPRDAGRSDAIHRPGRLRGGAPEDTGPPRHSRGRARPLEAHMSWLRCWWRQAARGPLCSQPQVLGGSRCLHSMHTSLGPGAGSPAWTTGDPSSMRPCSCVALAR